MKKLQKIISCFTLAGKKLSDDNINAFSAQAAFFLFVSLFPFIMLLLALLQFLPFTMEDLISAAETVLPTAAKDFVLPAISEIYEHGTPALISVTAVVAVWSASTGVNAIVIGLARISGGSIGNWFKLRIKSIFYMLALLALIILSLGLFVFGNLFLQHLAGLLPHIRIFSLLSSGIGWLCGICVLALVFDLLYIFAPGKPGSFTAEIPGAVFTALGWAGFSGLYSYYITNIANLSVYGSISLVIFFLLWMYVCFYLLFLGAEINCWLGDRRSRRKIIKLIDEIRQ